MLNGLGGSGFGEGNPPLNLLTSVLRGGGLLLTSGALDLATGKLVMLIWQFSIMS